MKIIEYVFNTSIDTLPRFNEGFEYSYSDVVNDDGTTTRTIEGDIRPTDITFTSKTGLIRVNEADGSDLEGCYAMFMGCTNLTYVNITNIVKSTELQGMFMNCEKLETIDGMETWDTTVNTSLAAMFSGCKKLKNFDVSNFDVSNVQAMGAMFRYCYEITEVDLSKWRTPNAQYISGMFTSCTGLTKLDLSSFNAENFGDTTGVANGCTNLTEINLSNWIFTEGNSVRLDNPTNRLGVTYFFNKCTNLNKLIMENTNYFTIDKIIDTLPTRTSDSKGQIILSMEEDLDEALSSKASSKYWDIVYEKKPHMYMIATYSFDPSISDLLPSFNEGFDYTYEDVPYGKYTLRTIKSTQLPTKMKFGTDDLSQKESSSLIVLQQCDVRELEDCIGMFKNCINLKSAKLFAIGNYKIKNISSMFEGCINYSSTVGNFFELEIKDMSNLYKDCTSLWGMDIKYIKINKNTKIDGIFDNCFIDTISTTQQNVNYLVDELPIRTLLSSGEIILITTHENIDCSEKLTQKHWYIDGLNNQVDLFVVMGQSNAQGQSETYKEFNVPDYQSFTHSYLNNEIIQVKHPFGENIQTLGDVSELRYYQLEGAVGCETGLPYGSLSPHFASKYYEVTKRPTLITPCCCGASTVSQWLPGHAQGRYELTVEKVNKAVDSAVGLGRKIRGKYLIWLQGESDGIYRTGTANYKTRFLQLWNALKEDLGFEKCFIIRVAKFRPDKYNDKPIIEAQEQLAFENEDIEMVTRITGYLEHPNENPTNPTIQDGVTEGYPYIDHYTWEGYRLVGETAGERIGAFVNTNVMPILEDEPYVGEITSSSKNLILDYKFNNTIDSNLLPTFNNSAPFEFEIKDTVEDTITRRKIIAQTRPTKITFNASKALLEVLSIDISEVVDGIQMFESCTALTSVKFNDRPTPKLISMERMFNKCASLTNIDFGGMTTENLKFLSATFSDCSVLETLDIGDWHVEQLEALSATFRYSKRLKNLDLSKWKVNNLLYMSGAFRDCQQLEHIDLSGVKSVDCTTIDQAFYGCTNLKSVDISSMKLSNSCSCQYVFQKCTNLVSIDMSNINVSNSSKWKNTFVSIPALERIGMLYCNEETCNAIKDAFKETTREVNIYVKDTKAEMYENTNIIIFKDYEYEEKSVKIILPNQLALNEKLYWDEDKGRYCILNPKGVVIDTNLDKRILFKIFNPNTILSVEEDKVPPINIKLKVPFNNKK